MLFSYLNLILIKVREFGYCILVFLQSFLIGIEMLKACLQNMLWSGYLQFCTTTT